MEREFGSVETRNLNGYTFKVFDEEGGYFVEVWKNDEKIRTFQDLDVWKESHRFVLEIYKISYTFQ